MSTIAFPIMYINDPEKGRPIFNGQMYFGKPDLDPEIFTNQKQVYYIQENGDLVAATHLTTHCVAPKLLVKWGALLVGYESKQPRPIRL